MAFSPYSPSVCVRWNSVLSVSELGNGLTRTSFRNIGWNDTKQDQQNKIFFLKMTRGPWSLTLCLRTNLTIDQSSRQIRADFPTCHIWAWNLPLAKVPEVTLILSSIPLGRNWAYFWFMGSGFQDLGQIFKITIKITITIFGHETWPLAIG